MIRYKCLKFKCKVPLRIKIYGKFISQRFFYEHFNLELEFLFFIIIKYN